MVDILIPADDRREQYVATGGQTVFPYNFPIFFDTDISVYRTNATPLPPVFAETEKLVLSVDYTVTGVENQNGGDIILITPASNGDIITVESDTVIDRLVDYQQAGDYFAVDVNFDMDRQITIDQELKRQADRSLRLRPEDPSANLLLPVADVRALNFLAFDENGDARAVRNLDENLTPVTTYMQAVLLADDAAEARLFLDAQEDVITTRGDLVIGNVSNVADRLPIGANNTFLKSNGTTALWSGLPTSSTSTQGIIEIATQGEVDAGTDNTKAVTPLTLTNFSGLGGGGVPPASETVQGIIEIATQAETDAGVDDLRAVTPLKLANYSGLGGGGGGSGSSTLITTLVASSSASLVVTFNDTLYDKIVLELDRIEASIGSTIFDLEASTDGGSTYISAYQHIMVNNADGGGRRQTDAPNGSTFPVNNVSGTSGGALGTFVTGEIQLFSPSTASEMAIHSDLTFTIDLPVTTSIPNRYVTVGCVKSGVNVDAVRIVPSAGLINSGTIRVYGILK